MSALDWICQWGSGPNFWSCQIWDQKIFNLLSTLDSEFFRGQVWANFFWSLQTWGQKFFRIFSFTEHNQLWIFQRGSGHQLFFIMPNLRSKNFQNLFIYRVLWTEFVRGVSGPTFFGHAKIETKKFFIYWALWTLNFSEDGSGPTFFVTSNLRSKIFSEFFHLHSTLDSEFFREGSLGTKFFESCQIWGENFFGISSFNKHCGLWICQRGIQANFFWSCQI